MLTLVIETATDRSLIGIVDLSAEPTVLYEVSLPHGLQSSQHLLPAIDEAMKVALVKFSDLDFITCGVGPGSYTGMRVGAAVGKMLAYVTKKPLIGVTSCLAFAEEEGIVLFDARYAGTYLYESGQPPRVCALEDIPHGLPLVSPHVEKIRGRLAAIGRTGDLFIDSYGSSLPLAVAGLQQFHAGADGLELLYLRLTQAENERLHFPLL